MFFHWTMQSRYTDLCWMWRSTPRALYSLTPLTPSVKMSSPKKRRAERECPMFNKERTTKYFLTEHRQKNDLLTKPYMLHGMSASGCAQVACRCTYALKTNNAHQIKNNVLRILARRDSVVSFRWLLSRFETGNAHWIGQGHLLPWVKWRRSGREWRSWRYHER